MANRWRNNGNSDRLNFLELKSHCRRWVPPWNEKILAPWKKHYEKPWQHIKKQRCCFADRGLIVKVMVFPVVIYGCESWTVKRAKHRKIDTCELWCWRRLLRVPWTAKRSNQSMLKEISTEYSLEGLMLKLKLQYFSHLLPRADSLEKTLMLGKIEGGRREGGDRRRGGWIASWLNGHEFE